MLKTGNFWETASTLIITRTMELKYSGMLPKKKLFVANPVCDFNLSIQSDNNFFGLYAFVVHSILLLFFDNRMAINLYTCMI